MVIKMRTIMIPMDRKNNSNNNNNNNNNNGKGNYNWNDKLARAPIGYFEVT